MVLPVNQTHTHLLPSLLIAFIVWCHRHQSPPTAYQSQACRHAGIFIPTHSLTHIIHQTGTHTRGTTEAADRELRDIDPHVAVVRKLIAQLLLRPSLHLILTSVSGDPITSGQLRQIVVYTWCRV